jgi:membrane protein DedA with SNARE-associated domain
VRYRTEASPGGRDSRYLAAVGRLYEQRRKNRARRRNVAITLKEPGFTLKEPGFGATLFSQQELIDFVSSYGYGVIALMVGLECLGLPLPGETILIAAAIYAGTSPHLNIGLVIVAAALGAIFGNTIGFWIGREGGYRLLLRYGPRLGMNESRIKLGQYLFLRHGGKIIFFSRFIAVMRVFGALLAGANRMSWPSFLVFNVASGIAWATLYGAGAYSLGKNVHVFTLYAGIGAGLAAVILIAAAAVFLRRHEARLQHEAERALPGPLSAP